MKARPERVLDDVLSRWQAGEPLPAILARYPRQSAELEALLRTAQAAAESLQPEPPSRAALERGRQRLLQHAAARRSRPRVWTGRLLPLAAGLAAVLLLVLAGWGTLAAAAGSPPGSSLYPARRLAESVRLWAAPDPTARAELRAGFALERRRQVDAVLRAGTTVRVEFEGELGRFDAASWTVGGLTVTLSHDTAVDGRPYAGALVAVRALARGGRLEALRLSVVDRPGTALPSPSAAGRTATPTATATPTRGPAEPAPLPSATPRPGPTRRPGPQPSPTPAPTGRPVDTPLPTATPPGGPPPAGSPGPAHTPGPPPGGPAQPTRPRGPGPGASPTPTPGAEPTASPGDGGPPQPTPTPRHTPRPTHTPRHTPRP